MKIEEAKKTLDIAKANLAEALFLRDISMCLTDFTGDTEKQNKTTTNIKELIQCQVTKLREAEIAYTEAGGHSNGS